jgi:hypothetical protein
MTSPTFRHWLPLAALCLVAAMPARAQSGTADTAAPDAATTPPERIRTAKLTDQKLQMLESRISRRIKMSNPVRLLA